MTLVKPCLHGAGAGGVGGTAGESAGGEGTAQAFVCVLGPPRPARGEDSSWVGKVGRASTCLQGCGGSWPPGLCAGFSPTAAEDVLPDVSGSARTNSARTNSAPRCGRAAGLSLPRVSQVGAPDPCCRFLAIPGARWAATPSKVHVWGPWGLSQGSGCSGGGVGAVNLPRPG